MKKFPLSDPGCGASWLIMSDQRLVFAEFGRPEAAVFLEDFELPAPGAGEAVVRMRAAPVNPADLNYIEGTYGIKPELPAAAGLEGFGVVEAVGDGVKDVAEGDEVLFLRSPGTWATRVLCTAHDLLVLPPGLPPLQAAMLKVNPMTALRMLQDFIDLPEGAWVMQNAATSAVGQCVIQLAKERGVRTLNVVRNLDQAGFLSDLGADLVLADGPDLANEVPDGIRPMLGLNAVGGDSATRMMSLLGKGGMMVTYGAMSRQALKVPNRFLIFDDLHLNGFWLTRWLRDARRAEIAAEYLELAEKMIDGVLRMEVAATHPLESHAAALDPGSGPRRGKILFQMDGPVAK